MKACPIDLNKLKKLIKENKINTIELVFTDIYGRMLGERLDADFFLLHPNNKIHVCKNLLASVINMKSLDDEGDMHEEYGDIILNPDFTTIQIPSWREKTALIICDPINVETSFPIQSAPRAILKKLIKQFDNLDYEIIVASELEFYLFKDSYESAAKNEYRNLTPFGCFSEDYNVLQGSREEVFNKNARYHLKKSGIPVEASKGENGVGQQEINVFYAPALLMADRHVVYKECLKEVASQLGHCITFMAKPFNDQPGSSCHVHINLWKNKKNIFVGSNKLGRVYCSKEFGWFMGGLIKHASEFMLFYAPTINSFKRFQNRSWAPFYLGWSKDNRTVSFRVVGQGEGLRIESRLGGADCNPYLLFSAIIASGLNGIINKIEPPEEFTGNSYKLLSDMALPTTYEGAIRTFEKSAFIKKVLGPKLVKQYLCFFKTELKAYNSVTTDWELKRYFEQI